MPSVLSPDVVVFLCTNCSPRGLNLPPQWSEEDARVLVREIPCSGKMDAQYLMHALEGGERGCCVVACPKGDCQLAQGNYRAEMRVRTMQRLLEEAGMEPNRIELLHLSQDDDPSHAEGLIRNTVQRICRMGVSPILAAR